MASSGKLISDKWNGAHWSFEWTSSVVSPGVTKVSWTLYARGRSSSPTKYVTKLKLYVNGKVKFERWDEAATFTDVKYDSGSFTVTHNEKGEGSFTARVYVTKIYDAVSTKSTQTITLDTNKPYSACGKATLDLGTSNIITPKGSVTLKWSGATGGTANPIAGYNIYRYITDGTSYVHSDSNKINSKLWTSSTYTDSNVGTEKDRGKNVIYKIVTVGKATEETGVNYNSDYSNQVSVAINVRPPQPKLTSSGKIIKSNGDSVTITLNSVTDTNSQSVSYYYSLNSTIPASVSDATKVVGSSITTDVIESDKVVYYFWSHDGLEFSEASTTFTITKNSKPGFSWNYGGSVLQSENLPPDTPTYVNDITIGQILGSGGQSNNNVYNFELGYGTSKEGLTWTSLFSFSGVSSTTKRSFNVRNKISQKLPKGLTDFIKQGYYYQIRGRRHDGIEYSDYKYSKTYYITQLPEFKSIYNKTFNTNIDDFKNYFLNKLYLEFDYDTGFNSVYLKTNGTIDEYSLTFSDKTAYVELNTSDNSIFPRGDLVNIKYSFDTGVTFFPTIPCTKILHLENLLNSFASNWDGNTWCPYRTSGSLPIRIGHTNLYTSFKDLGLLDTDQILLKFKGSSKNPIGINLKDLTSNSNGEYQYNIDNNIYFNLLSESLNFNSTNKVKLELSVTNIFGESYNIESGEFTVDFRENPQDLNFEFAYDSGKDEEGKLIYPISKLGFLKEGVPLYINGSVKSYNSSPVGQIYIKRDYESVAQPYGQSFQLTSLSQNAPTPGNPTEYFISNHLVQTIGKLLREDYKADFSIKITNGAGQTSDYVFLEQKQIYGHFSPDTSLNKVAYNADSKELVFNFATTKTLGLSTAIPPNNISVSMKLRVYQSENINIYQDCDIFPDTQSLIAYKNYNEDTENISLFAFGSSGAAYAKLIITTVFSTKPFNASEQNTIPDFQTEYIYETNALSFFNLLPTVSYRSNQVGINFTQIDEKNDCILGLGEYGDKHKLVYYPTAGVYPMGIIENFILDGGSW